MLNTYLVSVDVGTMRTKQQLLITWSTWSQMPMRNPDFYIPSRCGSNKVPMRCICQYIHHHALVGCYY